MRSEILTRILHRDLHFQGATFTAPDRYPELFEACREHLQHLGAPAILSFGCATGEEVFSLAHHLPNAFILGVDINRWCLKQCRRRNSNPRLTFVETHSPEFAVAGPFDAIFCMAVFQRTEYKDLNNGVIRNGFTFERFEESLRLLDIKLKPGGLLFVEHANFDFAQSGLAPRYEPLDFAENQTLHQGPLFDPENVLIRGESYLYRAFRKHPF